MDDLGKVERTRKSHTARMIVEFPNLYREMVDNAEPKDAGAIGLYYGLALTLMALQNIGILAAQQDYKGIIEELEAIGIPPGFRASDVAPQAPGTSGNKINYYDPAQREIWRQRTSDLKGSD